MEAICVFSVKVGTFTHLEQSKTSLLTVNKMGIVRLTIQHDLIVDVSLMYYPGDNLRQTSQNSFPSSNVLFIAHNHLISAVVHLNLSLKTTKQHQTDLLHISGLWETPETCSYTQQDLSWVQHTCWQLINPFWHVANYIILKTSHLFSLSSSSPIPHQQMMDTQAPQPGQRRFKPSRLAATSSNTSLIGTQQDRRHQLVHCDNANAATKNLPQDSYLNIVHKTGCSPNKKWHVVGCEFIHTMVNGHQLMEKHTEGVRPELHNQFIAAHNGKPL